MRIFLAVPALFFLSHQGQSQPYELKSSAQLYADVQKLERGLRVLYVAAHPDDENTRLIAWLEGHHHAEVAYLSLTRGEGGQNLIGDEQGPMLGMLRTEELLAARNIDGGEQLFTRAIDFGYSKSATESFAKWGKDLVLGDVVLAIRRFRPHIIITRFPPDRNAGHGHHEASALLAAEAFDLAANAEAYPEHLTAYQPWQATVLLQNTSNWWRKELETKTTGELAAEGITKHSIGQFDPFLGLTYTEVAAVARSMHRCQAFGSARARGSQHEYLQWVKGSPFTGFDEVEGVWEQSPEHKAAFAAVLRDFRFADLSHNAALVRTHVLPRLAQRNLWAEPADMATINEKVGALQVQLQGIRVEVFAPEAAVVIGGIMPLTFQIYNAGTAPEEVKLAFENWDTTLSIAPGTQAEWKKTFAAPSELSNPFWLSSSLANAYEITDVRHRNTPTNSELSASYSLKSIPAQVFHSPIHRKWVNRSVGEELQPLSIVPPLSITPALSSAVVKSGTETEITITIMAHADVSDVQIELQLPGNMLLAETVAPVTLRAGAQTDILLKLRTDKSFNGGKMSISAMASGRRCSAQYHHLAYDHVPQRLWQPPAEVNFHAVDVAAMAEPVLYVRGSGDEVARCLRQAGFNVDERELAEAANDLDKFRAVVLGVRAFNTNEECATYRDALMSYVERGGNLIVQYNTTYDLKTEALGPKPFTLGRDRVSEEEATPTLLVPNHPVFSIPNQLSGADWSGWVQERGLYFASEWDASFTPLLGWADTGEEQKNGGLLLCHQGKGSYFYTGISFFRQLPAGVGGAYRLLANMMAYKPSNP